jgi:two-component system sensor histidine kinase KdpD
LIDQLLKYQPSFELSIVPIIAEHRINFFKKRILLNLREILYVLSTTVISIVIASLGEKYLGIEDLSVIFITAVVFVASKTRMLAAAFSAMLFFLAYNFFFISPNLHLQISAHQA